MHPKQYESTTIKSIEAVSRPAIEHVRRPAVPDHVEKPATTHTITWEGRI